MTKRFKSQHKEMLIHVLHELNRINVPEFDYATRIYNGVYNGGNAYYLEELIPRIEKRRFSKDKAVNRGRVAIKLANDNFAVFQPRWLVPLQEELLAIEPLLAAMPEITTDYVVVWRDEGYVDRTHTNGLVPELEIELSESRQQYWTAKAIELNHARQPEITPSTHQAGLELK